MSNNIQNPGSALGEAVGTAMEKALNLFLKNIVENEGYHFISKSPFPGKKKLLLYDSFGNDYNIDAVVTNEKMQPIILFESKYIRYKKHNRDKASWVCNAHTSIRRHYESIRSSIIVLAGNWTSTSIAMLKSYDSNVFSIPFQSICDFFTDLNIDFDWDEKDRDTALESWQKYSQLTEQQQARIGFQMIDIIKTDLEDLVLKILDQNLERAIDEITLEIHSNLGEIKAYKFATVQKAIEFLNQLDLPKTFIADNSLTLLDPPPIIQE